MFEYPNTLKSRLDKHRPLDALLVSEHMQAFIGWYQQDAGSLHPVERAAWVHGEFVKIHPFANDSDRTVRLLMNLVLMKAGFPAPIIQVEQGLAYYEALDQAFCQQDYQPFIRLVADCIEQSFAPYWFALRITDKKEKADAGT